MRKYFGTVIVCLLVLSLSLNGFLLYKLWLVNKKDTLGENNPSQDIGSSDMRVDSSVNNQYKDTKGIIFFYGFDSSKKWGTNKYVKVEMDRHDDAICRVSVYQSDGTTISSSSFSSDVFYSLRDLFLQTSLDPIMPTTDKDGKVISQYYHSAICPFETDSTQQREFFCPSNIDQIEAEITRLAELTSE